MLIYEFDRQDPNHGEIFYVTPSRTRTPIAEFVVTWEKEGSYVGIYPYQIKSLTEQQQKSLQRDILREFEAKFKV